MQARLFKILSLFIILFNQVSGQENDGLIHTKEVSFENNSVTIAATLHTPSKLSNYPAVVIVHGSGTSTRENPWTLAFTKALVKRGIAVLHPDKRGSGKTTGDWRKSNINDLAEDVISGIDYLKSAAEIDSSRIGIIGFSQGGHVVPVAASKSSDIDFAISVSASVVPMMEQIMDEIVMMAERENLDENQIEVVKNVTRKAIHSALTGSNFEEYIDALNEAKASGLKECEVIDGFPVDPEDDSRTFINTIGNFDPMPYWKKIKIPILFVYGGNDRNVEVSKSIDRIETELNADIYNYSVLFFNNNGHALYREDLLDFIGRWINDKGAN